MFFSVLMEALFFNSIWSEVTFTPDTGKRTAPSDSNQNETLIRTRHEVCVCVKVTETENPIMVKWPPEVDASE